MEVDLLRLVYLALTEFTNRSISPVYALCRRNVFCTATQTILSRTPGSNLPPIWTPIGDCIPMPVWFYLFTYAGL